MWAVPDIQKVRLLIEHGAKVNTRSNSVRTPLLIAAAYPGTVDLLDLLLSAPTRAPKITRGLPDSAVKAAIEQIVRQQTATGGWSQLSQLDPDAYATGLSLFALHEAGISVTDDVYRRGVRVLLTTQYPNGSWLVRTRSFPVQPYFESAFPFGRHQWISAAGTAWAARAIALTLPDVRSALRN